MAEVKGSIEIGRPAKDVFEYLSDPKNNVEWEKSVLESELTSEGPIGVGTQGRIVENFLGSNKGTWEITEYAQDKVIAFAFESEQISGERRFELKSTDSDTTLKYWLEGTPRNAILKLLMPLMMPIFKREVRQDYERLKGILEERR